MQELYFVCIVQTQFEYVWCMNHNKIGGKAKAIESGTISPLLQYEYLYEQQLQENLENT